MIEFRRRCSEIGLSLPIALLWFVIAAAVVLLRAEVVGVLIFVGILTLLLALCDDVTVTTLPFLLVCLFVLKCYDSFDTFIAFAPLAPLPIAALLFHFVMNKRKFTIGKSFFGIVAVAIAVTLGGIGTISTGDYFSPTSLFYMGGLGIGMVLVYLILKREFAPSDRYALIERLFAIFYLVGLFGVFMLASHCLMEWKTVAEIGIKIQWANNLSTMMMFVMPIPFYYALTQNRLHCLVGVLFYITVALTGSRGGLLMGGCELILCLVFVSVYDKRIRQVAVIAGLLAMIAAVLCFDSIIHYYSNGIENVFWSKNEARANLLALSVQDFFANPIFGQGIGYTGNAGVYSPVKGAANWYHMMIPQIIGSLGTVGVIAYGYQFYTRIRLIFQKPIVLRRLTLGLSYAGIFLMSQVNPGEFCPLPYEMLTVLLFIFLELPEEEFVGKRKNAFIALRESFRKA